MFSTVLVLNLVSDPVRPLMVVQIEDDAIGAIDDVHERLRTKSASLMSSASLSGEQSQQSEAIHIGTIESVIYGLLNFIKSLQLAT